MKKSFVFRVLFVVVCLTWIAGLRVGEAQTPFPGIVGPELWIDGPDGVWPGSPVYPDVAVDNMGRRIHVWSAAGTGLVSTEVFVRRWDSQGNPLGDPMMVNTTTAFQQQYARVAVSADGSFLVIFQSWEPIAPMGVNRIMVRSQAFNANGDTVGTERLLSTLQTLDPSTVYADVAGLRNQDGSGGGYVVVWKSNQASGGDTNWSIEGCLVNTAGLPSAQFQLNSNTATNQTYPGVTELQDGGFLAAWSESGDVWGRRFNAAGAPVGDDFQISTLLTAQASEVDAAIGWNGRVLVAWAEGGDTIGTGSEIWGRLFDADLVPLGPDFRINTVTDDTQSHPRIADYGPLGFLVVWGSDVASGDDLGVSIEARVVTGPDAFDYDGDGINDPQLQFNTWDNNNNQQYPGAHGWYGRLAANWRSLTWDGDPPPLNINNAFVIGRDIENCVFCDDFDWFHPAGPGSLWRWSSNVEWNQ